MTTAVVVGSGPNGLSAAVRLAQAGVSVTVLEAANKPGGGTRTTEYGAPGVLHDDCSAFHPTGVISPFLRSLQLENFGLEWLWPELDLVHPLDDGSAGVLSRDMDRTVASLGRDGAKWRRVFEPMVRNVDYLIAEVFGTNLRYSGAGLGYQLASVIAGGPAPLIAAAVLASTGSSFWISVYIVGCAVVSLIALVAMRRGSPDDAPVTSPAEADRTSPRN